ncbi:hypothetical protein TSA6c_00325 [Azospirillum sp. TSA6c]|uniref:hypothetical protein n=1 Tax=Azospirillum sp. TSA6c TaxID=709813 RepID=UPI000D616D81|nr:hypothetical protein [Azospirillum sp. TSA6c]PWC54407.1 hypothetical protein TSA6c_00325 [Azospirillum sp. TSA6c]
MTDRLTNAFNALRAGGAVFAGRVRLTNWSDNARGMNASFRLDASADPLDNPATHPFKGAHCSPKDGHEFMLLCIPVATEEAKPTATPEPEATPAPAAEPERRQTTNANRAGMMIREPLFWQWIEAHYPYGCKDSGAADQFIKEECGIRSKTELDVDLDAAATFDAIRRRYYAWTQEPLSPAA